MNAFKRAWKYITRKPTKTVLLIITFFLIGNLVILGLGVSQAADNAKVLTRQRMRAAVSYEVDYD
ncbi:MAG: ABC transporter permease, partial [Solobacterium sp.]|nr:ABC transporter permease [Solobacterium sp.]